MYSVPEQRGQHFSKLFNFLKAVLGKLDKVYRIQEQPSNEALQARVRCVSADDVKDRILRESLAKPTSIWPESVENFRMPELQAYHINQILWGNLPKQREALRRL